ncbi:hypothetical protein RB4155 [Rhodopirellula baltica SH 1]|uniref:Uncharacterized protein n=1 Tax=Rhodopirellula baltica (strain DSM 10527 / NCIMB 13988 / SH1) TaxID=243090 RepID=Q7UT26_RHOBA|nr:hypothetical protein RB4155 [Rhodopirellula baltica SH 1]
MSGSVRRGYQHKTKSFQQTPPVVRWSSKTVAVPANVYDGLPRPSPLARFVRWPPEAVAD